MKLALLSDIHGNLPALRAVLDQVEEIAPDGLIVSGDLVGGPDFNETTSLLYDLGAWMILGNMDLDFIKFVDDIFSGEKKASRQWGFMRWHSQHASRDTENLLHELPEQREVSLQGLPSILVVHGSPRSPYESLFPDKELDRLDQALEDITQSVLVCGHIHVQWSRLIDGKLIVNPGAVSAPLQGDTHARFSILRYEDERWMLEPKVVEYDVEELRNRYRESRLLEAGGAVSKAFLIACETGRDVARPFYSFALLKVDKDILGHAEFIPDEIWHEAEQEFPWEMYEG